ncbi:MAG: BMP family ABC transporter substrate-binding protein, partial [Micrococcales bacterium]|nr:BMP family ABC transporter substrate-binding protein [Micrococcales bacterium]
VNEAAFLAGYLSVEVNENAGTLLDPSKYSFTTGDAGRKLGFIGGTQSDGITVFSYGFAEGANYAAKALGVTYTYYSNFSAGFTDTTLGAQTAGTFFSNGANIVYCEAGTLCNGVDVQAKKVQKLSIEADANLDGNQPGYVLTSVLKNTNVPTYDLGTDLVNGSLAAKGGTVISYTLSSGATGLTDLSTIGKFINTDSAAQAKWAQIQSDLKDVSGKIGDGTIKVTNAQIGETLDMSTLSNIKPA